MKHLLTVHEMKIVEEQRGKGSERKKEEEERRYGTIYEESGIKRLRP